METNNIKSYTTYKSIDIAKYIIAKSDQCGIELNMTKLQKLLYIVYGTLLALEDKEVYSIKIDENPKAWPYGPVFPKVKNILEVNEFDFYNYKNQFNDHLDKFDEIKGLKEIVEIVLKTFGERSASQLTIWSHKKGSPWWNVIERDRSLWNTVIPDDDIRSFFQSIMKKA